MAYNRKDFYFHQAKKEGFAARSVFKIEEIDKRFRLFKPGQTVVDLGCAPGSWSQFASIKVGPKGRVLSIDIQPVKITLPNVLFVTGDFRELDISGIMAQNEFRSGEIDIVMSDMAPNTSGIRDNDQMRSLELAEIALEFANANLKKGGHFVAKLFHSGEFEAYRAKIRQSFAKVEIVRPQSTRKESKEIFLIGLAKKAGPSVIAEE